MQYKPFMTLVDFVHDIKLLKLTKKGQNILNKIFAKTSRDVGMFCMW